jgi:hypothetical protein
MRTCSRAGSALKRSEGGPLRRRTRVGESSGDGVICQGSQNWGRCLRVEHTPTRADPAAPSAALGITGQGVASSWIWGTRSPVNVREFDPLRRRDLYLSQFGLGGLIQLAEVAWQQGLDLYSYGDSKVNEWHGAWSGCWG